MVARFGGDEFVIAQTGVLDKSEAEAATNYVDLERAAVFQGGGNLFNLHDWRCNGASRRRRG